MNNICSFFVIFVSKSNLAKINCLEKFHLNYVYVSIGFCFTRDFTQHYPNVSKGVYNSFWTCKISMTYVLLFCVVL